MNEKNGADQSGHKHNEMYKKFKVSDEEYVEMCNKFKKLCYAQAWDVIRRNSSNNHNFDIEDLIQTQLLSALKSTIYLKFYRYTEKCFAVCEKYVSTKKDKKLLDKLLGFWNNRKRHGAHRRTFNSQHEEQLEELVLKLVPEKEIPKPQDPIEMDAAFGVYFKSCTWNSTRSVGKSITKEKNLRVGMCSLSDYDYLGTYE